VVTKCSIFSEFLTAVLTKCSILWDITSSPLNVN
jgi:hypothetical protein